MKKWHYLSLILIGLLVLLLWIMLLSTDQVPELETAPWSILTHIAAECAMALLLIFSGILGLRASGVKPVLVAFSLGTLAYSLLNSSGYYIQRGEIPVAAGFGILMILTLHILRLLLMPKRT